MGTFCCFEVTIGFGGSERVDYVTYDTKGIWRFYEIKASKADFYSSANKTFLGHFNYYVMTKELYEQVKDDIPGHIGVYAGYCIKNPKKQKLGIDENVLKDSMIRSLYREAEKLMRSENPSIVQSLERQLDNAIKIRDDYKRKYHELMNKGIEKFGSRWER